MVLHLDPTAHFSKHQLSTNISSWPEVFYNIYASASAVLPLMPDDEGSTTVRSSLSPGAP